MNGNRYSLHGFIRVQHILLMNGRALQEAVACQVTFWYFGVEITLINQQAIQQF